jgi:tetratricopeptide (TPR) repeat protein
LEPPGAVEALPQHVATRFFSFTLDRFGEWKQSTFSRQRDIRHFAQLLERYADKLPKEEIMIILRAGIHRKAGNFQQAEALARAAMNHSPSWHAATALGLVLRQKGDLIGAESAFEWALRLDPKDMSARLEAGDTFFDRDQWQPALKWYQNALAKDPNQPWAKASALFCQWRITDEDKFRRELISFANKCPGNARAQYLCQEAYGGGLPEPVDATANLVRQFREMIRKEPDSFSPGSKLSINISSLEAPSNYLAFRLEMAALQRDVHLQVTVKSETNPDPRECIAKVQFPLWQYDGTDASPGLPSPGKDLAAKVAEIAEKPFDFLAYWASSSWLGNEVGADRIEELLAVMVHPPAVPSGMNALTWLPRVQFVAAAAAAHVEESWEKSMRREALLSILHGPMDWTTQAAIRVLTRLALENEALTLDIHEAFQLLAEHRPDCGHWGWVRLLYKSWLQLPHLFPPEREKMEHILREMDAEAKNKGK